MDVLNTVLVGMGHLNNLIGLIAFGFTVAIWRRLRKIKKEEPVPGKDDIVVLFHVQDDPQKMVRDLKMSALKDHTPILISGKDALGSARPVEMDHSSDDAKKIIQHFFRTIAPYTSRRIYLGYNGPAALSFSIGRLCANNYDIVQLHYQQGQGYLIPPTPSAEWRHWS